MSFALVLIFQENVRYPFRIRSSLYGKRGSNQLHLHALYDLCNKKYTDIANIIQKINCTITRSTVHSKKDPVRYKKLSPRSVFDFLDLEKDGKQAVYPMKLRIVRFLLDTGEYECIVTNLKRDAFPPWRIKELYHLRWGIETSFRKLKYSVGLSCFHSKKAEYVEQEIYARVIMYNFCESITPHVSTHQKKKQNTLTR